MGEIMIECNFDDIKNCQKHCKHYQECDLTIPFTTESYNKVKSIREKIKDCFTKWRFHNAINNEIRNEIRSLRNKEFMLLFELRKARGVLD